MRDVYEYECNVCHVYDNPGPFVIAYFRSLGIQACTDGGYMFTPTEIRALAEPGPAGTMDMALLRCQMQVQMKLAQRSGFDEDDDDDWSDGGGMADGDSGPRKLIDHEDDMHKDNGYCPDSNDALDMRIDISTHDACLEFIEGSLTLTGEFATRCTHPRAHALTNARTDTAYSFDCRYARVLDMASLASATPSARGSLTWVGTAVECDECDEESWNFEHQEGCTWSMGMQKSAWLTSLRTLLPGSEPDGPIMVSL